MSTAWGRAAQEHARDDMTPALVSCIMPTRDRPEFVAHSLQLFEAQDHPNLELIVVDDGVSPVGGLCAGHDRVRYERMPTAASTGAKRNRACELAAGDVIVHWDDDDWMAPGRVRRQLAALEAEPASEVCVIRDLLHYRLEQGDAFAYRGRMTPRPAFAGCSLAYRRSAWAGRPFPDVAVAEDSAFVSAFAVDRIVALDAPDLMVAVIHGGNTAPKNVTGAEWEPRPLDEVANLIGADRYFYAALRNGESWTPGEARPSLARESVALLVPLELNSGYGLLGEYLALGMLRAGADIRLTPLSLRPEGLAPDILARVRAADGAEHPSLFCSWIPEHLRGHMSGRERFAFTMWEGSRLPGYWAREMNDLQAVIVPSTFVADVCRASGVTAPIEVVALGVDPLVYRPEVRAERAGLTTLVVGPVVPRKHGAEAIAAWKEAFADDPDARLVIKTSYGYHNYTPDDPRITYIDEVEPTRGLAHYYREADVLLALGNEGFGLPLVEAMATGLPAIALDAEGQADTCRASGLVLTVPAASVERHDDSFVGPGGDRSVPAVADVVERLRWVDRHRDEARDLGRAGAAWVAEHRDIWATGPATLAVMEQRRIGGRRLRSPRYLWVPSLGRQCGIAESTRSLARHLVGAQLVGEEPSAAAGDVVHIQHGFSLIGDEELRTFARRARADGAGVVVTQHAVYRYGAAWEGDVDVLVSATAEGAVRLRERHPHVRVEHIPLGCNTWFPSRTRARGRVVATFGFPESHKGHAQLAAALGELAPVELIVFGAAEPDAVLPAEYPPNVSVRWIREYLPIQTIARRLGEEADVLVFCHEEVPHVSASASALVGLATGVPVLTSATTWFADLAECTYQPAELASGIEQLLDDTPLRDDLVAAARDYCHANAWSAIAARHAALWNSLDSH